MSGFVVQLASAAEGDVTDAFLWYRERNALVADAPLAKPADEDGNRKRVLRRFPYSVFYEVIADTVTVLAVAHHRRRPNYWHSAKV